MAKPFQQPVDIANRALQHCGATRITTMLDDSKNASEVNACYDGLRDSELRRNTWRFAIRRAVLYPINSSATGLNAPSTVIASNQTITQTMPTMLFLPEAWSNTVNYPFGSIVAHNDSIWVSVAPNNVGNEPGAAGVTLWDTYFGSMNVQPYDATKVYYVGDLVYTDTGTGALNVYVSLVSNNDDNPDKADPWSPTINYNQGTVVSDAQGYCWRSNVNLNQGNQPGVYGQWKVSATYAKGDLAFGTDLNLYQCAVATSTGQNPLTNPADWTLLGPAGSFPLWQASITYGAGTFVMGADGKVYRALNATTGVDPRTATYDPLATSTNTWYAIGISAPWVAQFNGSTGSGNWLNLDAGLAPMNINYPLGTGPATNTETRNIFQLPNGFLRKAPRDPKAGSSSFLGAPSGLQYDDWEFEGNYIVSRQPYPIIFRFVADVTQVPSMDPMFCEGLAARIASEVVETLTQSGSKLSNILSVYTKVMGDARTVNGIETGPEEPPEDDFITCRT